MSPTKAAKRRPAKRLDSITLEVLRQRLHAINDEQTLIAARMSGSPVAYEVRDLNATLMTPDGDALFVGVYVTRLSVSLDMTVKRILDSFNGRIREGDMFITNDPWAGTVHQSDFAVVAPLFWKGQIVAWTGIALHETDVGGPVPGSFGVGAQDIYGEAPLVPPIKIVEQGGVIPEAEALVLRNTRTPEINALNLKARIGSQNVTHRRLKEIIAHYGLEVFLEAQREIVRYVRRVLRKRLRELPNGTWCEHAYLDHDGQTPSCYEIRLAMTKRGEQLTFDFRGTSPQAPGPINCTRSGLVGGVYSALLPMLCYDLPWCTAAFKDLVDIVSEEGTVNNAHYPAGVSLATVEACETTTNVANLTLGKMLACSEKYKPEAMACWDPGTNAFILAGKDRKGKPLTGLYMTGIAGGGGARSHKDGIDSGGYLCAPFISLPNVERNESLYPVLELARRHLPDSGGHGKHRGGEGIEYLVTPYRCPEHLRIVFLSHGVSQPEGRGIYGGFPSSVQGHLVLRGTNLWDLLRTGALPTRPEELTFQDREVMPAKGFTVLEEGSVLVGFTPGGGGYGDPLCRDPRLVGRDVRAWRCSRRSAQNVYGVAFLGETSEVDEAATRDRRASLLAARLGGRVASNSLSRETLPDGSLFPVGDHLEVVRIGKRHIYRCKTCGQSLGPGERDLRELCHHREVPLEDLSDLNRFRGPGNFIFQQYCCPHCGICLSTDVCRTGDPPIGDSRFLF